MRTHGIFTHMSYTHVSRCVCVCACHVDTYLGVQECLADLNRMPSSNWSTRYTLTLPHTLMYPNTLMYTGMRHWWHSLGMGRGGWALFGSEVFFAHCNTVPHTATYCNCITLNWGHGMWWQGGFVEWRFLYDSWHILKYVVPKRFDVTLQRASTYCSKTQCNTMQHIATHCNTLQHTATHCNTLQHTATHYSTLR